METKKKAQNLGELGKQVKTAAIEILKANGAYIEGESNGKLSSSYEFEYGGSEGSTIKITQTRNGKGVKITEGWMGCDYTGENRYRTQEVFKAPADGKISTFQMGQWVGKLFAEKEKLDKKIDRMLAAYAKVLRK